MQDHMPETTQLPAATSSWKLVKEMLFSY